MPLDPSIPLQVRPMPALDPLAALERAYGMRQAGQQQQIQQQQIASNDLTMQAHQRALAEDAALRSLFAAGEPKPEQIYQIVGPQRGQEIVKGLASMKVENQKAFTSTQGIIGAQTGAILALPEPLRADAYQAARKNLLERGLITEQDAPPTYDEGFLQRTHTALLTPDKQEDLLNPKPVSMAPGSKLVQPRTGAVIASSPARPVAVSPGGQLVNPETGAVVASGGPRPKSLQAKDVMVDGKPTVATFDPATGRYAVNGQDVTDRVKPIPPASVTINNALRNGAPGDWNVSGDDFLKTIPAQWRKTVEKIARYEEDPTKVSSMRSGMRETLTQWVNQVNPDYDQAQFTSRSPMRKAFTSGPQGQAINSLNTAIGHLDQFVDVAKALNNGSFRPGNQAFNWLKTTFGDSAPTNFAGIKSIMAGELASAFKKSGATDQEIASVESAINGSNSASQLVDYATKIAIPALGSKVANYNAQYRQVMGEKDPFQVLSPDANTVLTKYGFDPAHPTIGGGKGTTPKPGIVEMLAPDGGKLHVPAADVEKYRALGAKEAR